jgi:hypothetical protein
MQARPFAELSPVEQEAVREAQKRSKQAKALAKQEKKAARRAAAAASAPSSCSLQRPAAATAAATAGGDGDGDPLLGGVRDYPTRISLESYFAACPGGRFRDPRLPPTGRSLALLMCDAMPCDAPPVHLAPCAGLCAWSSRAGWWWGAMVAVLRRKAAASSSVSTRR